MKSIIVALSLIGMAYAGGYGLDTLSSLNLGSYGSSYGSSYDSGDSYGSSGLSLGGDDLKGARLILVRSDDNGYGNGNGRSYGGDISSIGDLGLDSSRTEYGNYSPVPRQQIRLVGVPVPVSKPYPVPVDQPYTVKVDRPYPVKVERVEKRPYIAKVVRPVIEKTITISKKQSSY